MKQCPFCAVGSLRHRTGEIQGRDDQGSGPVTSLFLLRGDKDEMRHLTSRMVISDNSDLVIRTDQIVCRDNIEQTLDGI